MERSCSLLADIKQSVRAILEVQKTRRIILHLELEERTYIKAQLERRAQVFEDAKLQNSREIRHCDRRARTRVGGTAGCGAAGFPGDAASNFWGTAT